MGGPAVVTIRRQVLEVDLCGSEAEGQDLQRRLPTVCTDVVSPAVESALSAIDPREGYLYLDRLAIDVALTSLDAIDVELAPAVRHAIEDYLRRHPMPLAGASGGPDEARGAAWADGAGQFGEAGADGADESGKAGAGGAVEFGEARAGERRTVAQTVDDALVAFLRSGRLPWSFRLPPGRTLEQLILATWSDSGGHHDPPPAIRRRLPTVLAVPAARERLLVQFTPGFAMTLLRSLSPGAAGLVEQVEAAVRAVSPTPAALRTFTHQVRSVAVEAAVSGRVLSASVLVDRAWRATSPTGRADPTLAAAVEREWPRSTAPADQRGDVVTAEPAPVRPVTSDDSPAEACGLLVDSAGLVLLHPFLPRFFAGLGIIVADELVDPGRAMCLLHHLATGELSAPEHRLTLAKVLCGVPLERPVVADVGLTDAETAEATALLEAAIGHWKALRSTSADGLRVEFLQRPGVLSATADDDWLLRVEARTVDILLDQLPWGCSPIRLPWMKRMLMVEWR